MQSIRRYFIAGLLVITPVWGTYLILEALFVAMEGVLGSLLKESDVYIPGLGILLLLVFVVSVGALTTNFLGKKLLLIWEGLLVRVPLVRNVYSLVKSMVDALSFQTGDKNKFSRVVLIEYPRKGSHTLGFVTGEFKGNRDRLSSEKVINVFVPTVPNPISGFLLFVPETEVIPLTLGVDEAMKMVVSCGLYNPTMIVEAAR